MQHASGEFAAELIQTAKDMFTGKIIPYKGTWLEFETDKNDFLNVKIDHLRSHLVCFLIMICKKKYR